MSSGDQGFFDRDLDVKRSGVRFYRVVGCENSCCFPEGAVIQSMDCRELDDLAQFGGVNRSALEDRGFRVVAIGHQQSITEQIDQHPDVFTEYAGCP